MTLHERLPASLFIRAGARHAARSEAIWINEAALGRVCGPRGTAAMRAFVLSNYAYELRPSEKGTSDAEFLVDRYGTTGVKRYGGSGRAGVINGVQIKGIGRTSLVDPRADASHSHGRLSLREAVKESLFSTFASRMFPIGAVETLAVIRLGRFFESADGVEEEAALLVRPFVLRASHLQRATGFLEVGSGPAGHRHDVLRVREAIACVETLRGNHVLAHFVPSLAEQVAYCHLFRWFGGGALSSNFSIGGQMLDFGAADIAPSWRRCEFNSYGPAFGDEEHFSVEMIESLRFYCSKFGSVKPPSLAVLSHLYREAYDRTLVSAISSWLGAKCADLPANRREACVDTFREAFTAAQIANCDERSRRIEAESVFNIGRLLSVAAPSEADWMGVAGFSVVGAAEIDLRFAQCDLMTSDEIRGAMNEILVEQKMGRKPKR